MRRTFQRLYDTSPAEYRARFRSSSLLDRQTMASAEEDVKIAI
jgi:hypothetical protein